MTRFVSETQHRHFAGFLVINLHLGQRHILMQL